MNRCAATAVTGLALVAGSIAGCAATSPIGAASPAPASRDELLLATGDAVWRGDLHGAQTALAQLADRERNKPDTALDFWSELLALLRCEPLDTAPRAETGGQPLVDPWERLRRLVQIERLRLARTARTDTVSIADSASTLAAEARRERKLVWPVEAERWNDEVPLAALATRCPPADAARLAGGGKSSGTRPGAPEATLVAATAGTLPPDHPAVPLLLIQAAVLRIERGEGAEAAAPLARLERLGAALPRADADGVALAAALAAIADQNTSPAEVALRGWAALAVAPTPEARRDLQLVLSERLADRGRAEDATAMRGAPPHGDDAIGHYLAFRQVEAHAASGRHAELLAEARELLHDKSRAQVAADPVLSAVMDVALRTLLASPVSPETLELLEALGLPRERSLRAEAFAQLALETGVFSSAMATFSWLYDNETDRNRKLQHLARATVAAARASDRTAFARNFRTLAGQEEERDHPDEGTRPGAPGADQAKRPKARVRPPATINRGDAEEMILTAETRKTREARRASRSLNWERALLVVARDALPPLVENDDQANLATLVDTLKRHLDDGGRGPVDEDLTTLYRAASAHLKTGARAYAETLGSKRRPILLGDVFVGRKYDVQAPLVDLTSGVREVGALVFVPRRGNDPSVTARDRWPGELGVAWAGRRS